LSVYFIEIAIFLSLESIFSVQLAVILKHEKPLFHLFNYLKLWVNMLSHWLLSSIN